MISLVRFLLLILKPGLGLAGVYIHLSKGGEPFIVTNLMPIRGSRLIRVFSHINLEALLEFVCFHLQFVNLLLVSVSDLLE